jgi:hypothetical protein
LIDNRFDFSWDLSRPREVGWLKNLDFDPGIIVDQYGLMFQGSFHRHRRLAPEWRRYVGGSQDRLRRVENARLDASFAEEARTLGAGFGGWWAGAIWPAPDDRWYTTVHAEFAYRRPRGPSYAHSRRIYSALSADRGATWSLIGPIVSSDPNRPGPPRERWLDFGDGDQKLVVDNANGFLYLYYLDGWMDTHEFTLGGMTTKVARCALAEADSAGRLMPVGAWEKWYRGDWSQPGLGGRASSIWPAPHGVGSGVESGGQPTIFFSSALQRFVALGKGWISTARDLQTQDWTPQDHSWPGSHLWYTWAVSAETGGRDRVGQSFRLYSVRTTDRAIVQDAEFRLGVRTPTFNLIEDSGFESGSLTKWRHGGDVEVTDELAMSGDYAACLRSHGSFIAQSIDDVVAGMYHVRAWVALPADSGVRCDVAGETAVARTHEPKHFHGYEGGRPALDFEFRTLERGALEVRFTCEQTTGPIYIDDVTLVRRSPAPK